MSTKTTLKRNISSDQAACNRRDLSDHRVRLPVSPATWYWASLVGTGRGMEGLELDRLLRASVISTMAAVFSRSYSYWMENRR